jgi:hypothetical protein
MGADKRRQFAVSGPHSAVRYLLSAICLLLPAFALAVSPGAGTVRQALLNLKKLHSFEFSLTMISTGTPEVNGNFRGTVFLPDTEERNGYWQTIDGRVSLHMKARGETEYSREDSLWTIHTRGEETGFLIQLERALSLDSFRTPAKKDKYLSVTFVPSLPFLDPTQTRRLTGTIRIRKDRMLPEEITARSPDSSVYWQVRLGSFDQAEPIAFPFVRQWCATLLTLSENVELEDTLILRDRFRAAGYETRFEPGGGAIQVFLEQEIRDDLLRCFIAPGNLMLGLGRFTDAAQPGPAGFRRVTLAGDSAKAIVIERTVLDPSGWTAITHTESLADAFFALPLTKSGQNQLARLSQLENSGSNWALVMDDRVIAFAPVEHRPNPARLELNVSGSRILVRQVGSIARTGPLGSLYRVGGVSQIKQ